MTRVLLGIEDLALLHLVRTLLSEIGDCSVVGSVSTSEEVLDTLEELHSDVEVVLLHEGLQRTPLLQLVREIALRHPGAGVLLLLREGTPEILSAAMEAGARGVLTLPLELEAMDARLHATSSWSRAVREHISGETSDLQEGRRGSVVAVAGVKGGVGTTLLAVHLALAAANAGRAVCLVDLDLQAGDVANYFDVQFHRSLVDLIEVADDMTKRVLQEALYTHDSNLQLLLAPAEGEHGEEVPSRAVHQVVSALRSRFDLVVVDGGSHMNQANTAAIETADRVLLVTTPDVVATRAAQRMIQFWQRLHVRKNEDVLLVVNRSSRRCEIQPALVARAVGVPVAGVDLPARFKDLEKSVNTGRPHQVRSGPYSRNVGKLAAELGLTGVHASAPATVEHGQRRGRRAAKAHRSSRVKRSETEESDGAVRLPPQRRADDHRIPRSVPGSPDGARSGVARRRARAHLHARRRRRSGGGSSRRSRPRRQSRRVAGSTGGLAERRRHHSRALAALESRPGAATGGGRESHRATALPRCLEHVPARLGTGRGSHGGPPVISSCAPRSRRRTVGQRGQSSLELLGLFPLLLLVLVVALQLGIAVYAAQQADSAARAAARAEVLGGDGHTVGVDAIDSWLRAGSTVSVSGGHASVRVRIPGVLSLFPPVYIDRTADMPSKE